jgi:hypothetical protein
MDKEINPPNLLDSEPLNLEQQLNLARRLFQMEMNRAGLRTLEQVKASSLVALAETLLTGVGCLARMDRRLAYIQLHLSSLQRQVQSLADLQRQRALDARSPEEGQAKEAEP